MTPEGRPEKHSHAEADERGGARVVDGVDIDHRGIVSRYVDDLGLCGLHFDDRVGDEHDLILVQPFHYGIGHHHDLL
jgi:hypothetical protein